MENNDEILVGENGDIVVKDNGLRNVVRSMSGRTVRHWESLLDIGAGRPEVRVYGKTPRRKGKRRLNKVRDAKVVLNGQADFQLYPELQIGGTADT